MKKESNYKNDWIDWLILAGIFIAGAIAGTFSIMLYFNLFV